MWISIIYRANKLMNKRVNIFHTDSVSWLFTDTLCFVGGFLTEYNKLFFGMALQKHILFIQMVFLTEKNHCNKLRIYINMLLTYKTIFFFFLHNIKGALMMWFICNFQTWFSHVSICGEGRVKKPPKQDSICNSHASPLVFCNIASL